MNETAAIGKTIAQLRQALHLTQKALAASLYVSHQAVSKWEHGIALPDILTLYSLCRLFGVSMEQLITGDVSQRLDALRPQAV